MRESVCSHFGDNLLLVTVGHALEVKFLPGKYLRLWVSPVTGEKGCEFCLAYHTVRLALDFPNYTE